MARKTFTVSNNPNAEPVEFTITGSMADGGPFEATFQCLPDVPGRYLTDAVAKLAEGRELALGEITGFVERCLATDDERARFIAMTNDPKVLVKSDMLAEIMRWLMEEYGGRPLDTPQSWSTGASPTPTTSPVTGPPPASTPWGNPPATS